MYENKKYIYNCYFLLFLFNRNEWGNKYVNLKILYIILHSVLFYYIHYYFIILFFDYLIILIYLLQDK